MDPQIKKISERIRTLRISRKIPQWDLAQRLGISQTNLSNIENGRTALTLGNLLKIREILECSMTDFFDEEPELEEVVQALKMLKKLKDFH